MKLLSLALFFYVLSPLVYAQEKRPEKVHVPSKSAFKNAKVQGIIRDERLSEISGIAPSGKYPHHYWVHNDSGHAPYLFLIDEKGKTRATFHLVNAPHQDWEDMAVGRVPASENGPAYLYIGDIGDNGRKRAVKSILRIREPVSLPPADSLRRLEAVETIRFRYPGPGPQHNAEALMVEPFSGDVYVLSKSRDSTEVYRLPYQQQYAEEVIVLEKVCRLYPKVKSRLDQVTAAAISPDGRELLIKSYNHIYYWRREDQHTPLSDLLQTRPAILPYKVEPQGESIGFSADGSGFFTLSEKRFSIKPRLFFYQRK
ncbi:hypothetical protein OKW21_004969 [Catalinimonas alkaloidigena]|uniref:hypothetical protein n=1 Tax=Catalinimonas alkaloidigena TaxID=1075417 RepID=UPI00240701F4|nr:hypothetical protein [Catalinimonas alkaloidigena]MDF9799706.1 hypothetical protein [Catalinimonas alkaloidigena]